MALATRKYTPTRVRKLRLQHEEIHTHRRVNEPDFDQYHQ